MNPRILMVEESRPVAAALRKHLEGAGWSVDAAAPDRAVGSLDPAVHQVAILGADSSGEALVPGLKKAVPWLPVVLVFSPDQDDADTRATAAGADGLLVGPLKKPAVVGCVSAMARMGGLVQQIHDLERRVEAALASGPKPEGKGDEASAAKGRRPPPTDADSLYDFDFFKKLLLMEIKRSKRYRYPISLALVSVDPWRSAAAKLEPRARARLLGELLALVTRTVRDIDIPLLFAEEKFLVFMPHTTAEGAMIVARRLCNKLRAHKGEVAITASVGVASFEGEGTVSFASIIKGATEALRKAQLEGGDRAERIGADKKRERIVMG